MTERLNPHTSFALVCLGIAAVHVPVLRVLVALGARDASASHHPLIPIIACGLLWEVGRNGFRSAGWHPEGLRLIFPAAVISILSAVSRPIVGPEWWLTLSVLALVIMWIGAFLLFYGGKAFRAAAFPLVFLLFTVPLPSAVLDPLVQILKHGTVVAVGGLFTIVGMSYQREGSVFWLPGLAIEVADQCSGIRSTIALTLTALLTGHLVLRSWWRKTVLLLAVLPVTILKNGLRIVVLAWLSTHVDAGFMTGPLHRDGGMLFFTVALLMLAPVVVLLRHGETRIPLRAGIRRDKTVLPSRASA